MNFSFLMLPLLKDRQLSNELPQPIEDAKPDDKNNKHNNYS